ncbi:MAG: ankyrin repeat domain-containing protein [Vicinamibacterales bacterium]
MRMHSAFARFWLFSGVAASVLVPAARGFAADGSPIAMAVKDRDHAALRLLIDQRVDVNQPMADGATALHWAVYQDDVDTVRLLIGAGANVNAANRYGATPLWMASSEGNAGLVEVLLNAGANPHAAALGGEPVLLAAARAGSLEAVKAILERGPDVNAKEARHGQTALMVAAGGREPHPEIVQVLLEYGADVNVRAAAGLTPLLFAVRQGDLASTQLLVKAGANVNEQATPPNGAHMEIFSDQSWSYPHADTSSALTIAVNNGYYELAAFLLESGANPNVAGDPYPYRTRPNHTLARESLKPGLTSLHALMVRRASAAGRNEDDQTLALIKAMIEHGADVNAKTPSVRAPEIQQPNPQPAITWVEAGGITPFWIAANTLDIEAMKLLVASGADPRLASMEQTTPLMVAAGLGTRTRGPSSGLGRREGTDVNEVVKLLLEWGNDINAANEHGQTALHGAAFAVAHRTVQFLVDNGARTDLVDVMGRRPLEVAKDSLRVEYRPSLQNHDPADVEQTIALLEQLTGN